MRKHKEQYLKAARYSGSPMGGSSPPVQATLTLNPSPGPAPTCERAMAAVKAWMWPAGVLGQCPEQAPALSGSGEAGLGVPVARGGPARFAKLAEEQQKLRRLPDISQSLATISPRPRAPGCRLGRSFGSAASWVKRAGSGTKGQGTDANPPSAQSQRCPAPLDVTFATSAASPGQSRADLAASWCFLPRQRPRYRGRSCHRRDDVKRCKEHQGPCRRSAGSRCRGEHPRRRGGLGERSSFQP